MVQYIRRLEEIPGFSDIPAPGHKNIKVVDKILVDPVTGSQNFMLIWAKLEAGSGATLHTHPVEQAYFVLSGALKVRIGGKEFLAEKNSEFSCLHNLRLELATLPVIVDIITTHRKSPELTRFKHSQLINRPHR